MIVRILEDAEYEIDAATAARLETLDHDLDAAIQSRDEDRFAKALEALENAVHESGRRLDPTDIVPSDLTIPHHGASLSEVTELLSSEPVEEN